MESIPASREAASEVVNAREVLKSRLAIVVQVGPGYDSELMSHMNVMTTML